MDDIYFSDKDKKRKSSAGEPHSSKRISSDRFLDSDYDDEVFELDFKQKGTSQPFPSKSSNFIVDIPDLDDDIPELLNLQPTKHDIYSSGQSRTPQGKRVAPGTVRKVPTPRAEATATPRTP